MNFDEILKNRRSARLFTDENVSDKQIKNIIESAMLAPSAKNRQPWRFYILNKEQKNHIMNMLFEWDKQNPKERTSVKGTAEQIESANKMIMIYRPKYKSKSKDIFYKKPDYISLGCALENMCLQAINLGLGSCILCDTLYLETEIDEYLGIKDYEQVCGFIFGYPIYNYSKKPREKYENLLLS